MIVAKFAGYNTTTAYGLTQWDYGQELVIECPELDISDGTEVNFYQGRLSSTAYLKSKHVLIPDLMLQSAEDMTAYVYVRSESSGETILSIRIPIASRPRPEDYILPEHEASSRLIPDGGKEGQTIRKQNEKNYSIVWGDTADSMDLTDGVLQLMSGPRPIGKRIRLPVTSGQEIELKNDGIAIVWRYTNSNDWIQLVALEELKGQPGDTPDFEIRNGHLIAIYQN